MRESNKVSSASRLILPLHREQIILRSEFIQIQILLWDIIHICLEEALLSHKSATARLNLVRTLRGVSRYQDFHVDSKIYSFLSPTVTCGGNLTCFKEHLCRRIAFIVELWGYEPDNKAW